MPHWRLSQIESDLIQLISLIKKYTLDQYIETSNLQKLLNSIQTDKLHHQIEDIVFNPNIKGLQAMESFPKVLLILNLRYEFISTPSDMNDPFMNYQLDLYIKGYRSPKADHSTQEDKFFSWHLDRDGKTRRERAHTYHPYYHFQAGGRALSGKKIDEEMLIVNAPRIPHPPMDVFLSIHFILENFFNKSKHISELEILNDENYIMIIQRAQKRLLEPYYKVLSNTGVTHNDYSPSNLFPQYS